MLSTKYSIQVLARNFRSGVRCMCKKPDDLGVRDEPWNENKVTEERVETIAKKEKNVDNGSKTIKPQQLGTGDLYVDNRHLKPPPPENPIHRTGRILADDIRSIKHYFPFSLLQKDKKNVNLRKHILPDFNRMAELGPDNDRDPNIFPSHVDICIIGGGAIGSSIAYFLKEKARQGLNIAVLEKDKTVSMRIFALKKPLVAPLHQYYYYYGRTVVISVHRSFNNIICRRP